MHSSTGNAGESGWIKINIEVGLITSLIVNRESMPLHIHQHIYFHLPF